MLLIVIGSSIPSSSNQGAPKVKGTGGVHGLAASTATTARSDGVGVGSMKEVSLEEWDYL